MDQENAHEQRVAQINLDLRGQLAVCVASRENPHIISILRTLVILTDPDGVNEDVDLSADLSALQTGATADAPQKRLAPVALVSENKPSPEGDKSEHVHNLSVYGRCISCGFCQHLTVRDGTCITCDQPVADAAEVSA